MGANLNASWCSWRSEFEFRLSGWKQTQTLEESKRSLWQSNSLDLALNLLTVCAWRIWMEVRSSITWEWLSHIPSFLSRGGAECLQLTQSCFAASRRRSSYRQGMLGQFCFQSSADAIRRPCQNLDARTGKRALNKS